MIDVMIDLETMGTKANSPILSIGLVSFSLGQQSVPSVSCEIHVALWDCLDQGLKPSADTILWWMQQSDEARSYAIANQKDAHPISEALYQVSDFFLNLHEDPGYIRVWSNGAGFDIPMLAHLYSLHRHMEVPWMFYNERCFRTMKSMYKNVPAPLFEGIRHSAVADAQHQVDHLQAIWKVNGNQA